MESEHLATNQKVGGSNPLGGTINKGVIMKVLAQNVRLFFECINDCPNNKEEQIDLKKLITIGAPVCPICDEEMKLQKDCLVIN